MSYGLTKTREEVGCRKDKSCDLASIRVRISGRSERSKQTSQLLTNNKQLSLERAVPAGSKRTNRRRFAVGIFRRETRGYFAEKAQRNRERAQKENPAFKSKTQQTTKDFGTLQGLQIRQFRLSPYPTPIKNF